MKIMLPNGEQVPDWVFRCKDVVLYASTKAPDGGLLKDEGGDIRCGLRLAVDNDDVGSAEVEFALQRLINDLHAAGWTIDSVDGAG